MTESFAFANRGIITVTGVTPGYVGSTTLGVVKDVDLSWSAEHVPLYGWGLTTRQAVAKHTEKVSVKIGWMKFDPTYTTWFPMAILAPASVTPTGTTSGTNVVKLFTITAKFYMEVATPVSVMGTVNNVFFPDFPIKAAEGQWIKMDLNGEGSDVVFSNPGS